MSHQFFHIAKDSLSGLNCLSVVASGSASVLLIMCHSQCSSLLMLYHRLLSNNSQKCISSSYLIPKTQTADNLHQNISCRASRDCSMFPLPCSFALFLISLGTTTLCAVIHNQKFVSHCPSALPSYPSLSSNNLLSNSFSDFALFLQKHFSLFSLVQVLISDLNYCSSVLSSVSASYLSLVDLSFIQSVQGASAAAFPKCQQFSSHRLIKTHTVSILCPVANAILSFPVSLNDFHSFSDIQFHHHFQ